MRNFVLRTCVVVAMLSAVVFPGCAQKEKMEINRLTLANQDLAGQVQQLQDDLDNKQADLINCQDHLSSLTGSRDSLAKQLEEARKRKLPEGFEVRNGMVMTTLPEAVLFDSGKAVLKGGASSSLNKVISQIRTNFPGRDVFIVGHTDSDPIRKTKKLWQDNLGLSLARSAAVTRYLVKNGLSAKQVITGGVGEYRPVASNANRAGKAKNRRVEFWILKPGK